MEREHSPYVGLKYQEILKIIYGLLFVIFLGTLDQTIVSVSLPEMSRQLGGVSLLSWVVSGYLVASTVSTPVYGKLGDLYGRRRILFIALSIFLLASIACALSWSMPVLVAARVLQGIGGGGLMSTAQAIVGEVVPLRDRGRYQGYISVVYALANVGGPVLGGYLTHYLSWNWIFWINLPLGLTAILVSNHALKVLHVPGVRRPIDYLGIALLSGGLSATLIAITLLGQRQASSRPIAVFLLVSSIICFVAFIRHERRAPEPIIPLELFKIPTVWMGCMILFISFFQVISWAVLIPLGMHALDGIGSRLAAVHLITFTLAVPVGAFISGRLMMRWGRYKPLQIVGTGLLAVANLGLAATGPHPNTLTDLALASAGFAAGLTMPTSLVAVQNAVSPRYIGIVTGVIGLFRSMGGAIGVTLLTSLLFAFLPASDVAANAALDLTPASDGIALLQGQLNANTAFAFQMTFLVSALIAGAGHCLAWMIPDAHLAPTSEQSR